MNKQLEELAQRLATCAKEDTYPVLSPADCGALIEALEASEQTLEREREKSRRVMSEIEQLRTELAAAPYPAPVVVVIPSIWKHYKAAQVASIYEQAMNDAGVKWRSVDDE